jgi:hypothetical protein
MFPTAPPAEGTPYGVYWPTTVPAFEVTQTVHVDDGDGGTTVLGPFPSGRSDDDGDFTYAAPHEPRTHWLEAPTARSLLGNLVGARSGDKGGDANVGLWVRPSGDRALDTARYEWLTQYVDDARVHALLPETRALRVDVHHFANLHAVNVVVHGLLGRGVADSTSLDPQAKGLGEHLRARVVDVPVALLPGAAHQGDAGGGGAA